MSAIASFASPFIARWTTWILDHHRCSRAELARLLVLSALFGFFIRYITLRFKAGNVYMPDLQEMYPTTLWATPGELLSIQYPRLKYHKTRWFKATSNVLIVNPPDFSLHPLAQVGDVFMNRAEAGCRFWILEAGVEARCVWKRIPFGYGNGTGRRLSVSPDGCKPVWLKESSFLSTLQARKPVNDYPYYDLLQ